LKQKVMQISDSEKFIMDVLWKNSPQSARAIIEQLEQSVDWQDKTVKTLINRLLKKGAIGFEKNGREYLYYAILNENDYISTESENFIAKVFKGKVSNLVAAFAKNDNLSAQEVSDLKQLINELDSHKVSKK
jgi:BlaI family transcriptional regulator, penicillinase repressor